MMTLDFTEAQQVCPEFQFINFENNLNGNLVMHGQSLSAGCFMSYKKVNNLILELTLRSQRSFQERTIHPFYFTIQINDNDCSLPGTQLNIITEASFDGWTDLDFVESSSNKYNSYQYIVDPDAITFGPSTCSNGWPSPNILLLSINAPETSFTYTVSNWGNFILLTIEIIGQLQSEVTVTVNNTTSTFTAGSVNPTISVYTKDL